MTIDIMLGIEGQRPNSRRIYTLTIHEHTEPDGTPTGDISWHGYWHESLEGIHNSSNTLSDDITSLFQYPIVLLGKAKALYPHLSNEQRRA